MMMRGAGRAMMTAGKTVAMGEGGGIVKRMRGRMRMSETSAVISSYGQRHEDYGRVWPRSCPFI